MISASAFSKPSPSWFEKGRLFGSEHTRSSVSAAETGDASTSRSTASTAEGARHAGECGIPGRTSPVWPPPPGGAKRSPAMSNLLLTSRHRGSRLVSSRQCEYIDGAARSGVIRQVLHRPNEPDRAKWHIRIEVARNDSARPSANACCNRDVLPAVRPLVSDRLPDDSRVNAKSPQHFTRFGVDGFEPPVHRAVEGNSAGGSDRAAPYGEVLLDRPDLLPGHRVPRHVLAAMSLRSRFHRDFRSHERRAGDVARFDGTHVHAQVLMRHVDQPGLGGICGGLPILGAGCRGADVPGNLPFSWLLRRHVVRPSGLKVDAFGYGNVLVRLRREYFAGFAIEYVHVAVSLGANQHRPVRSADIEVDEQVFVDSVV